MGDVFILLLLAATIIYLIEWAPEWVGIIPTYLLSASIIVSGIFSLPGWFGWFLLLFGVVGFIWQHLSYQHKAIGPNVLAITLNGMRDGFAWVQGAVTRSPRQIRAQPTSMNHAEQGAGASKQPIDMIRLWIGAAILLVSSPLVAILMHVPLASVLLASSSENGTGSWQDTAIQDLFRRILGTAIISFYATLELITREFLILVPLILLGTYLGARYAACSIFFWRKLSLALLAMGALYTGIYVVGYIVLGSKQPYWD